MTEILIRKGDKHTKDFVCAFCKDKIGKHRKFYASGLVNPFYAHTHCIEMVAERMKENQLRIEKFNRYKITNGYHGYQKGVKIEIDHDGIKVEVKNE